MQQTELYFLMQNIATFIGLGILGILGIWIISIILICLIDNIKDKFKKRRTKPK
ncbi:MAG: hypothetical protein IJH39_01245 [Clostridia bacterium]|nr:hypothetical protein [Clostridia bacterium]